MRRETTRGGRGWIYAILVAICLLLLFYVGGIVAQRRGVSYRDPRTTVLTVSTMPKSPKRIATDNIPLEIEPLEQVLASQAWTDYRREYTHSIALLEPPAGVRLMAPVRHPSEDLLPSPSYGRDPVQIATDAAQDVEVRTSLVSTARDNWSVSIHRVPPSVEHIDAPSGRRTWPQSPQLRNLLLETFTVVEAEQSNEARVALNQIAEALEALAEVEIKDGRSRGHLEFLRDCGLRCSEISNQVAAENGLLSSALLRVAYAIERRASIWMAVHDCVARGEQLVSLRQHEVSSQSVQERIATLESVLQRTGDAANWKQYLLLDRVRDMATAGIRGDDEQVTLAREFLARVLNPNTMDEQRAILTSPEVHDLADLMHPLTIRPVDYVRLMQDVETLEADPTHRSSLSLAEAIQSLRFSEHPEQAAISHALAAHYRNANIRIAVSEEFANRMLPKQSFTQKPVRQTILGADTRGASQISTKLRVDFVEDPSAWKVALQLDGDISSNTRSSRNGATFYNTSLANVQSSREIRIHSAGFQVDGKPASVKSNDSLKKFSTEWDNLPILGDVVRNIAHQEFVESRPIATRIMQSTIAKETDREFDKQLNSKLQESQAQLETRLFGPLQVLSLQPMIMDMQSTDSRLIVRYRVASEHQIGAHTARPIAPADSLISMQVHQSAFNNVASQIATADRDWTAQDLSDQIAELLQQPRYVIDSEQAKDVRIRFHANNPITVEFEHNKLWLSLRIDSLEEPGRIHLKNFIVRASYAPKISGLNAELERDGVISIDGHKLASRDRLALRVIFDRILSNRQSVPMVAESLLRDERVAGLAVSQFEMRDGWLAIAISEEQSPHVAVLQQAMLSR
ncbi:hypothetical protein VN12_19475 [Pirellula sp. SH-Sr6A]|uniref:hypothetical protein n=1 Tax=Pirellula sp. SH-Sr6A TaxID=1632865 RepID=UPI00078B296F|nr:hypothetical protein [Pirellula sp. SH-Sr6A]AMV34315.1 hypothetical protein VN12_19475 [Pirellula sp. SH-Sr6A]